MGKLLAQIDAGGQFSTQGIDRATLAIVGGIAALGAMVVLWIIIRTAVAAGVRDAKRRP